MEGDGGRRPTDGMGRNIHIGETNYANSQFSFGGMKSDTPMRTVLHI